MNLLELLEEYRINKIDYEGYKLDIKLAKITDDLTEEERQSEIEELKHKMDLVYKKIELVDKYDFSEFKETHSRLIKEIYIDGLILKNLDYAKYHTLYARLQALKEKLKDINL